MTTNNKISTVSVAKSADRAGKFISIEAFLSHHDSRIPVEKKERRTRYQGLREEVEAEICRDILTDHQIQFIDDSLNAAEEALKNAVRIIEKQMTMFNYFEFRGDRGDPIKRWYNQKPADLTNVIHRSEIKGRKEIFVKLFWIFMPKS